MGNSLRTLRTKRGWTHEHAAERMGISRGQFIKLERGERQLTSRTIALAAKAFGVAETEIIAQAVPVVSWISAGRLAHGGPVTEEDEVRTIAVNDLPQGDWIALVVEGDSMDRVAPEGSIIIVNRDDRALVHDRFYVFTRDDGEATFKRYRSDPPRLQPYSTNPDHETVHIRDDGTHVIGRVMRVITDLW